MNEISNGTTHNAILRFPRKRGRPKSVRANNDSGTPELIMKRLMGETAEALDLCLERGIITREQHWCGIHLRWLYTLRHGAPGLRAIDPTHLGGLEIKLDNPQWKDAREQEYTEAMQKLKRYGCAQILLNLCIHNERPAFLASQKKISHKAAEEYSVRINRVQQALDILVALWSKANV